MRDRVPTALLLVLVGCGAGNSGGEPGAAGKPSDNTPDGSSGTAGGYADSGASDSSDGGTNASPDGGPSGASDGGSSDSSDGSPGIVLGTSCGSPPPVSSKGAAYYVDYDTGSDSNAGTSKSAPWKRAPGMQGFSGSYTHGPGDRFFFKGGVVWPASVFGMTIAAGGTSGNPDYYGADTTWYSGNSWTRPVFDNQNAVRQDLIVVKASYVTFDNVEMKNFFWDGTITSWETSFINLGTSTYVTIQNSYFHHWAHAADATDDSFNCIVGGGRGPWPGNVIDSCIFDGEDTGADSGAAVYHGVGIVRNSISRNMANGFLVGGGDGTDEEVSCCDIGPINASFKGRHENGIENQDSPNSIKVFNNFIHDMNAVVIFLGGGANTANDYYVYNNVMWNTNAGPYAQPAIRFDARNGPWTAYVYNNVLATTSAPSVYSLGSYATHLEARNNQFITDVSNDNPYAGVVPNVESNNLLQTTARATAAGYVAASRYRPSSTTGPTVNAGMTLAPLFTADILGVSRPQGGAWDIGPYEE